MMIEIERIFRQFQMTHENIIHMIHHLDDIFMSHLGQELDFFLSSALSHIS